MIPICVAQCELIGNKISTIIGGGMMEEYQELNPEKHYDYSQNVNLDHLPADLDYLFVLDFNSLTANKQDYKKLKPFVFTYKDPFTKEITDASDSLKDKSLVLTYRNGHRLPSNYTMQDIKKVLGRDNINGLTFFTSTSLQDQYDSQSSDQIYIDECCLMDYKTSNEEFGGKQMYDLLVKVRQESGDPEVLALRVDPECKAQILKKQILRMMRIDYGLSLQETDIKSLIIDQCQKQIIWGNNILNQNIYNKSILNLELADPKLKIKRIPSKQHNSYLIIYKEGQKEPQKFKYEDIAQLTFQQLYESHKLRIAQTNKKYVIYALKIMDMIIRPKELISKAQAYFRNTNSAPTSVVAKIITEKMVFYHTIPALTQKKDFSLDQITIPKQQLQKRDQCRNLSRLRAENSKIQYFKVVQNLQPILVYTSQLKYEDKDSKLHVIYQSLNRFLREKQLLTLQGAEIDKQWKYRYASSLIRHLEQITPYEGLVYRGINYDPKLQQKDLITFKQFLSTSVNQKTAETFAKENAQGKTKHIFKMYVNNGYPIKDYSSFIGQEQVLLLPFTEFEVKSIVIQKRQNCQFKFYELHQVQSSKKLPQVKANFIVWIDDCPEQGKQIYEKIQLPIQTTILVQLLSTEQLTLWLEKNAKLFQDPTANLIFISDMTRKEGKVWNPIAGIQGYRQILKYDQKATIFFYIGDKAAALQKCKDNQVDFSMITIGNQIKQIHSFISKHIEYYKEQ